MERWGEGGVADRIGYYSADDTKEILCKKGILFDLLVGQELNLDENFVVKVGTKILYDHFIKEKSMNTIHVDYSYTGVAQFDSTYVWQPSGC